jgi:hypothetical protein
MSPRRHSDDVEENHSLPAPSRSKVGTLDATVAGLRHSSDRGDNRDQPTEKDAIVEIPTNQLSR